MVTVIINLESQDYVSLEAFAQYGYHLHDLSMPSGGQTVAEALQEISDTLDTFQAGHFTSITSIGSGIQEAMHELSDGSMGQYNNGAPVPHSRARSGAAKIIIVLTDGKPNVDEYGTFVGNDDPAAISWVQESAEAAKDAGMTIYSIGVGADVNAELCMDIASAPENYFFADNSPDPDNGGRPLYVNQLEDIFQTLGGRRPVNLIK